MSGGTFRESRTEFTVRGLTGTELATWFQELFAAGLDDATIINAHPEHWVLLRSHLRSSLNGLW